MAKEKEILEPMNMKVGVSKGKLVITVDLKDYMDKAVLSESGKSYILATSRGNQDLKSKEYQDIKWGCNVYIPKKRFEELKRIEELKALGGSEVTGLPSQADARIIEEKNAEIASMKAQMEAQQQAMAQMQEMMAQMMAMQQANMAQSQQPQQLEIVEPEKKQAKKS